MVASWVLQPGVITELGSELFNLSYCIKCVGLPKNEGIVNIKITHSNDVKSCSIINWKVHSE